MILARHGDTLYEQYINGKTFDLTDIGVNQGIELASSISRNIDFVVCSQQNRAKAFAVVIADILGVKIVQDPLLNSFVGENIVGYKSKVDEIQSQGESLMYVYKCGELDRMDGIFTPREIILQRKSQFLVKYAASNIVAITHGEVIHEWVGQNISRGRAIDINFNEALIPSKDLV